MIYYMYQITNNVNGKIYVGVHKTKSLDDGYMGSGKIIRRAIKKHGIANFSKDILEYFDDSVSMYAKEVEVVNEEFLLREDVYNINLGGAGSWNYVNSLNRLDIRDYTGHGINNPASFKNNETVRIKANMASHTESAEIMRKETRIRNGNSNEFKRWVTDGLTNKYVKITEVDEFLILNLSFKFGKIQRK